MNVIDSRQSYPQMMVKQALEAMGYADQASQLQHVSYGVVSLSPETAASLGIDTQDGRASYAMSGRQGIGIKIADFLDRMEEVIAQKRSRKSGLSSSQIASAAVRYYLLRFHLQTEIVFDLQQATEISGNTGVYLLYAYARAMSVIQKAEKEQQEHPAVPAEAVHEMAPQQICQYTYELASMFNYFYASCPILSAQIELKSFRLWLTVQFQQTCKDALQVLDLPTPNRM